MKDWQLVETPASGPAIMDMETQDIVCYIDDISPEIAGKVCTMHNDGMTLEWISAALANDNGCFEDQREFIIENIIAYEKLTNMSEEQLEKVHTETLGENYGSQDAVKTELTRGEKAAATRKANAVKNGNGTSAPKKDSTAVAIKILEEKIALIKLLDGAEVLDIPTGLGKAARELMTAFQNEQQTLIDSYLEKVQSL